MDEQRKREVPQAEVEDVASVTDCTGLMPALPADDEEADAIASLYAVHGVKGTRKKLYKGH